VSGNLRRTKSQIETAAKDESEDFYDCGSPQAAEGKGRRGASNMSNLICACKPNTTTKPTKRKEKKKKKTHPEENPHTHETNTTKQTKKKKKNEVRPFSFRSLVNLAKTGGMKELSSSIPLRLAIHIFESVP